MASFSYYLSVFGSLFLHGIVIVLMVSNWQTVDEPEMRVQPRVIQAQLIELEAKAPPQRTEVIDLTARRQAEEAEQRRQAQIQREREEQERQRQLEEQRRREEAQRQEQQRQAEEERRQQELERQRQEQQAAEQRAQEEFQRALREEESYQAAMAEQELVDAVGYEIQQSVELNWSRPPSARRGMQVILRVSLVPTGGLTSVDIVESSGDSAFDRSAMQATQKAAPFDAVTELEPAVFERNFRTFQFRFNPQDLRL
jgi:colicin import membrane protein